MSFWIAPEAILYDIDIFDFTVYVAICLYMMKIKPVIADNEIRTDLTYMFVDRTWYFI